MFTLSKVFWNYFSKDFYKILDLDKKASISEIKKAYSKLVRKHHPDKNHS